MTREEIRKTLDNTKVYVNGKSKEIQEKLFSLGYEWNNGEKTIDNTDCTFLFIDDKSIAYSNSMLYFSNCPSKEITAEQILSFEITEPSYRPFKSQEECWEGMQKHQPFGWLCQKCDGYYVPIRFDIYEDTAFSYWFNKYTFADGTPFGILEK